MFAPIFRYFSASFLSLRTRGSASSVLLAYCDLPLAVSVSEPFNPKSTLLFRALPIAAPREPPTAPSAHWNNNSASSPAPPDRKSCKMRIQLATPIAKPTTKAQRKRPLFRLAAAPASAARKSVMSASREKNKQTVIHILSPIK